MPAPGPTSDTSDTAAEETLRREAERILLSSAARLIGVLHRVAGETGLALGHAFRDIVLDREMPPTSWPLADVLDLLASHSARRDGHAGQLLALLSNLSRHVDMLEAAEPWDDYAWEDEDRVSSVPRAA